MSEISLSTSKKEELIDITSKINDIVGSSKVKKGICIVYCPHTTAGITINENADPDVKYDIIRTLEQTIPWQGNYRHSEGNSAAHIKASMMGFSVTIPVESGRLLLGTWQCIYFCEFDGPRSRNVIVYMIGS